jgi:hypothetical protein
VVARPAGAVRHHQEPKYAGQQAQQQAAYQEAYDEGAAAAQAAPPPVYAAAPAPAPAPSAGIDLDQLKQLGDLHAAGVLTDEEFATAKAKLLGG